MKHLHHLLKPAAPALFGLTCTLALLLQGCANLGYTPEQLKAMPQGLIQCTYFRGMQGSTGGVTMNSEELKRSVTATMKVTISPEQGCATTVEGASTAAGKSASAP